MLVDCLAVSCVHQDALLSKLNHLVDALTFRPELLEKLLLLYGSFVVISDSHRASILAHLIHDSDFIAF